MDIRFTNNVEKQNFEHYKKVRGEGIYQVVYEVLVLYSELTIISAEDFNGLVRYDKRLRDTLYIYLATLEEFLRNRCCMFLEYSGNKQIRKYNAAVSKLIYPSKTYGRNLFKFIFFTLDDLIQLIQDYNIDIELENIQTRYELLVNAKNLRNKVMHHQMLLIDVSKDLYKNNIRKNIHQLNKEIQSLSQLLPKEWTMGLKKDIVKANLNKNGELISKYLAVEV